jgi:hypothetical protein
LRVIRLVTLSPEETPMSNTITMTTIVAVRPANPSWQWT